MYLWTWRACQQAPASASKCQQCQQHRQAPPPAPRFLPPQVSEGFTTAKDLARKLIALFSLSRELLSPQRHYDWGLRALKTSLGIAGRELREVGAGAGMGGEGLGAEAG